MARIMIATIVLAVLYTALCKPVDNILEKVASSARAEPHAMQKRFINRDLTYGDFVDNGATKMRTKRSEEEDCEKYELCKLHAESGHSFLAAYELYFVNKENARLWDHRARSIANCDHRFRHCFED